MSFKNTLNITLLVMLNCLGTGGLTIVPLISDFGAGAFYSWILTALGALGIGMTFVSIAGSKTNHAIQDIISSELPQKYQKLTETVIFWGYWLFAVIGNAASIILVGEGLKALGLQTSILTYLAIVAFLYALNHINFGNLTHTQTLNNAMSVLKVCIMIGLPLICFFKLKCDLPIQVSSGSIAACMFHTLWPFTGIESIMMEANAKSRDLRRGIWIGLAICLIIYIGNTWIMMTNLPNISSLTVPDQILFEKLFPNHKYLFNLVIIIIGFSSLQGWTYISNSMSVERGINASISSLLSYGIPIVSIFIAKILFPNANIFGVIFQLCTLILLLIYFAGLGVFVKRLTDGHGKRDLPYFVLGLVYTIIASIGFGFECIYG